MKRKKLSFLAVSQTNSLKLSGGELSQISPLGLMEIFNSFAKIPLSNDDSLIVAGSLADNVDFEPCGDSPQQKIKDILSASGLSPEDATQIEEKLLEGKTVVLES